MEITYVNTSKWIYYIVYLGQSDPNLLSKLNDLLANNLTLKSSDQVLDNILKNSLQPQSSDEV